MATQETFNQAVINSKQLKQRPSNDKLLALYSLYKQATQGDIIGNRPGGFDFKGGAKYDAWQALKGVSKEEAMQKYIALVNQLVASE